MRNATLKLGSVLVVGAAILASTAGSAPRAWKQGAPVPTPRSEVAAALVGTEILVAGGFLANGFNSAQVEAYSPARNRWRRLPDLPVQLDHAMAAGHRGRLYVAGGYGADRAPLRRAFVFTRAWSELPPMPAARAAAGAAVLRGKLYVVGGVGPGGLARTALVFDLQRRTWSEIPGPSPREHLGAAAAAGRVYAVAGRTAGFDTNLDLLEAYDPASRKWRRLPPVPGRRGGTGATASAGKIVSAGGEATPGTIATVFAYDVRRRRWQRLPRLPTARHGLGVVAAGGRVYVLAGGKTPGLSVSGTNEFLVLE